ncbi:MAG TPA: endolytic transglycosylase MltG [Gemmatimonadales bacterium]|nr:endolytic transglycosylase MltG [Gemmatimonadales bacterium]
MRRFMAMLLLLAGCGGTPAADGTTERIVVPPGATFGNVLDSLEAHDLIGSRFFLKLRAKVTGADRAVHAGIYEIPRGTSHSGILRLLGQGQQLEVRFTVPEGLTIGDIAELAETRLGIPADSFIAAARDSLLADSLGIAVPSFEGFLRPDTYQLPSDITARALVRRLAHEFLQVWKPEWDARLDTLDMTRAELLALASIVEGEARVDEEREVIAGVYHNRLRIGMALQADPTVQYAIMLRTGERKKRLYEKDYGFESPYNTYLHPGLPPGPVNSPGRRSIEAALYPDTVPYLFFVARPDGRHVFTRTYREHLRAVADSRRARAASGE